MSRIYRFIVLVALITSGFSLTVSAAGFKAKLQLAWGTDGSKPGGKDWTELDAKAKAKLRNLRWKNYWVVKTAESTVSGASQRTVLSDKCAVDTREVAGGFLEVRIFDLKAGSEPKLVKTVQHAIKALKGGEYCIIAGDDKNSWENAWVVIITGGQ